MGDDRAAHPLAFMEPLPCQVLACVIRSCPCTHLRAYDSHLTDVELEAQKDVVAQPRSQS